MTAKVLLLTAFLAGTGIAETHNAETILSFEGVRNRGPGPNGELARLIDTPFLSIDLNISQ